MHVVMSYVNVVLCLIGPRNMVVCNPFQSTTLSYRVILSCCYIDQSVILFIKLFWSVEFELLDYIPADVSPVTKLNLPFYPHNASKLVITLWRNFLVPLLQNSIIYLSLRDMNWINSKLICDYNPKYENVQSIGA